MVGGDMLACAPDSMQSTIGNRLEREKKQLTERLKLVTEALEALNKNPELKEVIEKLSAITHF